jgi:DnaJ-class molecular chaperone
MIIKIRKIPNGVIGVDSNGQFIHEQETKGGQFAPLELPEFPKVREPFTESCERCYGHGTIMGPKTCPDCKGEGGR